MSVNNPIPESDLDAWAENQQLCGEYLPRIGAASDLAAQQALYCELATKLFDSWARRRIVLVKCPADIPAFEAEQAKQTKSIVRTYLSDGLFLIVGGLAVDLAFAGRRRYWLAEAVLRTQGDGVSVDNASGLSPATTPTSATLTLLTADDRKAAVQAYLQEVSDRTGNKITKTDIWKTARYKSRSEFERWERNDRRATKTAHQRFSRILTEKPHLK